MPIRRKLKQLGKRLIEYKDLKSQRTCYGKMYLAFILNYLEIKFSTACFICVCVFFSPNEAKNSFSQSNSGYSEPRKHISES